MAPDRAHIHPESKIKENLIKLPKSMIRSYFFLTAGFMSAEMSAPPLRHLVGFQRRSRWRCSTALPATYFHFLSCRRVTRRTSPPHSPCHSSPSTKWVSVGTDCTSGGRQEDVVRSTARRGSTIWDDQQPTRGSVFYPFPATLSP